MFLLWVLVVLRILRPLYVKKFIRVKHGSPSKPPSPPTERPPRYNHEITPGQNRHVKTCCALKQLPTILLIGVLQKERIEIEAIRVAVEHILLLSPNDAITLNYYSKRSM